MTKCFAVKGYIGRDRFGRIVIDTCKSNEEHLRYSVVLPGDDRSRCQILLENYFNEYVNGRYRLSIDVSSRPLEDDE